jgi:hypothetical protein
MKSRKRKQEGRENTEKTKQMLDVRGWMLEGAR